MTHQTNKSPATPDSLIDFSSPELQKIFTQGQKMTVPAGQTVFRQGDNCQNYLIVVNGCVKVLARAENGREIVLYRVTEGSTCVLTTSCLLGHNAYPAEGITETETTAIALPRAVFDEGINNNAVFRQFVFNTYAQRLSGLITLFEEVTLGRLDIRLASYLIKMRNSAGTLSATHQQLAAELGSSREVISRLLKNFEKQGWVHLSRGHIENINIGALETFSNKA